MASLAAQAADMIASDAGFRNQFDREHKDFHGVRPASLASVLRSILRAMSLTRPSDSPVSLAAPRRRAKPQHQFIYRSLNQPTTLIPT